MRRWIVMDGDRPVHFCDRKQDWIAGHHAYAFMEYRMAYTVMRQVRRPYYEKANQAGNEFYEAGAGQGFDAPGFRENLDKAMKVRIIPVVG